MSTQTTTHPVTLTDATFDSHLAGSPIPVLVDFWAPWCGPCRMLAPTLDQLATELAGKVQIAKLNIDENPAAASRYRVASIPTLIVFHNGREVDRIVGLQPKQAIAQRLARLAA
jgi:thioredoxin